MLMNTKLRIVELTTAFEMIKRKYYVFLKIEITERKIKFYHQI